MRSYLQDVGVVLAGTAVVAVFWLFRLGDGIVLDAPERRLFRPGDYEAWVTAAVVCFVGVYIEGRIRRGKCSVRLWLSILLVESAITVFRNPQLLLIPIGILKGIASLPIHVIA